MLRANVFSAIKIRTKITLVYISVLILSFALSFFMFSIIHEKKVEQEVGNAAMQTVSALKGNLGFIFENVTQFSDLIYFDKNVQRSLLSSNSVEIEANVQQTIQKSLINMLLSGDYISSVFIFDSHMNYYHSYKSGPILVNKARVKESNWYEEMKKAGGDVLFIHKSEGVLSFPTKKNMNYITLIREIADVDTYDPLAVLLITVDESTIQDYFTEVGKEYDSIFSIVDDKGNYIIYPKDYNDSMDRYLLSNEQTIKGYETINNGSKMIVVNKELGISNWRLVGAFPMSEGNISLTESYRSFIILIIFFNLLFVFICSLVLTKLIFYPLNKVQKHMKLVEQGNMRIMAVDENNKDEINVLKHVFNQMISSIEELIRKVKQEEKVIAKHELDLLQAQINPHFLYNSLDAISALALIEDNENCLKMTQALGNFYRNSLNSGLELIKVKDEIECIESYITVLNIRYDNKIKLICEIEEEIKELLILKLILQPLVENAAYHGLRNKLGSGNITIKGYRDEEEIIFVVSDDGLGMSSDRVDEILEGKHKKDKSGFGIYSSSQRISLYYDIKNPITISSEVLTGTEVYVRVKVITGKEGNSYEKEGFNR